MEQEEITAIFDKIIREHCKDLDFMASYNHYMLFGEIKLIYKDLELKELDCLLKKVEQQAAKLLNSLNKINESQENLCKPKE